MNTKEPPVDKNNTSANRTKPKVDPTFEARITSISFKGEVVIRFNKPLLQFANATDLISDPKVLEVKVKDQ